jgi:starch-binding outer membrane protein, SusD/RagB family
MKNRSLISLLLTIVISASSCKKDFLDKQPDDMLTIDQVFANRKSTEEFLANVYSFMNDEGNGDGANYTSASDEADFAETPVPGNALNMGSWGPANVPYDVWGHYYQAIRSASIFIQRVDECKELSTTLRAQYKAEARVLRAYFYHLMMRQYGPVVLIKDALPVDAAPADVAIPRSPYDATVDYILAELDEASKSLPARVIDNNQLGRPDQMMVNALKSRILLYAASPLFNGNPDYANFTSADGTSLVSRVYDPNKWKKAADAAKVVIDAMPSGLYKKFAANGDYDPVASYRDIYFDRWNKEVIWARRSPGAGTWEWNCGLVQVGGYINYGVTQQLVDAFFMANGQSPISGYGSAGEPSVNASSGYVESGSAPVSGKYSPAGVWNMYVNREPRFYATVTYNGSEWLYHGADGQSKWFAEFFAAGKDGLQGGARGQNPTKTGYVIRKYSSGNSDVFNRRLIQNPSWISFRLGEMYLNYAEALNESNPGNSDILKYLNLIRERAGIPQYGEGALAIPSSQSAMREAIIKERRIELVFEGHRVFDTRRWKIAPVTDGANIYGMSMNAGSSLSDPAFYKRIVVEDRTFERKHYLWPISQGELERNKQLTQNPGW